MSTDRSSPVRVRVDAPGSSLGPRSCRVITPSISTDGAPATTATSTTLIPGSKNPAGSSAPVMIDLLLTANVS